ncbi:unnamed protein product [Adineta steineri]|uniref:F-box domain-containing protein n=2 Tax=Adineta steineri TaxID=433720 RepID=A0A815LNR9_9BILA|nr:unnamed protein product [Adineta steineri]
MESSCIKFSDLPDEILMIILKKLNNLDVLYSLQGVNQRINKFIQDRIFTNRLTFVKWLSDHFLDLICCDIIYNRFCLQILPEIHHNIRWLDLESTSMKHVLCAARYPNLHSLGLYNIHEKSLQYLLTDENLSSCMFKKQIKTLLITIDDSRSMLDTVVNIVDDILTVFISLNDLILYESFYKNRVRLFFLNPPSPRFRSSTLRKLNIRLQCMSDCLYLLDGRFDQLQTLHVDLINLCNSIGIQNDKDLPNLKDFSLSSNVESDTYSESILPLLGRMSNVEALSLYFAVCVNEKFIDGNHLMNDIIDYMPWLNHFSFYIRSVMHLRNQINLPSTKDIQSTFVNFSNHTIISYVDYFQKAKQGQCHIYSYPSFTPYYNSISNNFPGGLFKHVRAISLYDEHPFEHEFFLQIVHSFPSMEKLTLTNREPQNGKQLNNNNNNKNLSVIEYSYLHELIIIDVHSDYIEEFLVDTKTYFSKDIFLSINYESLKYVTHNFTRDDTRINCAKINELELFPASQCTNVLGDYFPNANLCFLEQ